MKKAAKRMAKLLAAVMTIQTTLSSNADAYIPEENTISELAHQYYFQRELEFYKRELTRQQKRLKEKDQLDPEEVTEMLENLIMMYDATKILRRLYQQEKIEKGVSPTNIPNFENILEECKKTMESIITEYTEMIRLELMYAMSEKVDITRKSQAQRMLILFLREYENLKGFYADAAIITKSRIILFHIDQIIYIKKEIEKITKK